MRNSKSTLITGDIIVLAVITIIGFVSHGETELSFLPRMLTTFIPLVVSWFLIAPWLGLFDKLWRPPLAMLLAAPMTSILRATLLNGTALPLFTLILGGSAALGLFIWRGVWNWVNQRRSARRVANSH